MWVMIIQDHNQKILDVFGLVDEEEGIKLLVRWGYQQLYPGRWFGNELWATLKEVSSPPSADRTGAN